LAKLFNLKAKISEIIGAKNIQIVVLSMKLDSLSFDFLILLQIILPVKAGILSGK
jgi:hypothetical protein